MAPTEPSYPVVELRLKRRIWSQNEQRRAHWSRQRRERDAWLTLLHIALVNLCGRLTMPRPEKRCAVTITSHRNRLVLDKGNLVGGAKELVDAMVMCGLMRDDSDEWAEFTYLQATCPKGQDFTVVRVSQL